MPTQLPITTLNLPGFTVYTRPTYLAATGKDAPTQDLTRPVKTWIGSGLFNYFDISSGTIRQQVIDPSWHEVNLPGVHSYPPYMRPPSRAAFNTGSLIAENLLATPDEAAMICKDFGMLPTALVDFGATGFGPFVAVYPADEPRRYYTLPWKGSQLTVATMVGEKYANGVGAPGHWDLNSGGEPNWISEQPTSLPIDPRPPVPLPVRALVANESIQRGGLFGDWFLVVADAQSFSPDSSLDGDFTDTDRSNLNWVAAKLRSMFGQ